METVTIQQAFDIAFQHHQSGRLAEAEGIYRQILAVEPGHAATLRMLGIIAHQVGKNEVAVDFLRRAIGCEPNFPVAYDNLGSILSALGRVDEAIAAYRQAIALMPGYAEAHSNLGASLRGKGLLAEAVAACERAVALEPGNANAHVNLGAALAAMARIEEAIAMYRQATVLKPDLAEAHGNLGAALMKVGEVEGAMAACRRAIALKPDFAEAHCNLGAALRVNRQLEEAMEACRRAIALHPNYPVAQNNLGNAIQESGRLEEAIAAYRGAIALLPDYAEAYGNLGAVLSRVGRWDEAMAALRKAVALKPDFAEAHSNLLLTLHYQPAPDVAAIAAEHRSWNRQHAEPLRPFILPHANDRTPVRRLRIGYVSSDFREHSVAFFLENLLANHDGAEVEVFCYANVARPDAVTARLRQYAAHWRSIVGLTDAQAADLIRRDGIDILVDLAGHTAANRLLIFARKPAPVQVTWLGYPNTTGMETMDYRMTDAFADPPGTTEELHSEELVRLADGAWCFRPIEDAPPVGGLPAVQAGHVTFGCCNARPKINGPLLKLWSRILLAVPGSRLLLKNSSLADHSTREGIWRALGEWGIAPERIEMMEPAKTIHTHLASYDRVDIALDTFPYHGTTTTCEALWMGVPVVCLLGATHASRVGLSLLGSAGVPELVAGSEEEYIHLAANLANDLPRLALLRSTLRERMSASPLMDAPRFARNVERVYRRMWEAWCRGSEPPLA